MASGKRTQYPAPDSFALAVIGCALAGSFIGVLATSAYMAVDLSVLCVGIAGTVAAVGFLRVRADAPSLSRIEIAGIALVAWLMIASIISDRGAAAFLGHPGSGVGILVIVAGASLTTYARARGAAIAYWLRSIAPWLVSFQTILVMIQYATGSIPRGTLPNSSYLAELTLLLLPFVHDTRRPRDSWRWIVTGIAIIGFAVSGARIAFVVALVWVAYEALRVRLGGTRKMTGVLAAVLGVLSFGVGWVTAPGDFGRWGLSSLAGDRFAIWRTAAEAIAARPIAGWGADGFAVAGPKMATVELAQEGFAPVFGELTTSPHNVLLSIGVAGGVIALLLVLWLAGEIIRTLVLSRKAGELNTDVHSAAWSLTLFCALVLTAPAVPQVLPVFGIVLGLLLGTLPVTERLGWNSARAWSSGIVITAALASVALVVSSSARVAGDSVGPNNALDRAVVIQRVADAIRIDPHLYYQAALQWGYASGFDASSASQERDIEAIDRAIELDPAFYLYELERARALTFYGASEDVLVGALEPVLKDYPASPEANARIGVQKVLRGSILEARVHLDLAVRQSPLDVATLSSIAQGYGLLGENALQEEYATRARDLSDEAR